MRVWSGYPETYILKTTIEARNWFCIIMICFCNVYMSCYNSKDQSKVSFSTNNYSENNDVKRKIIAIQAFR